MTRPRDNPLLVLRKILVALLNLKVYEDMHAIVNRRAADARQRAEFIAHQLESDYAGATPECLEKMAGELAEAERARERQEKGIASLDGGVPGTDRSQIHGERGTIASLEVDGHHVLHLRGDDVYGASDADPQVQAEAIAALGRLGDPRAVAPLAGLLEDGLAAVAGVAASALTRIAQRSPEGRTAVLLECRARAAAAPSAAPSSTRSAPPTR